jgi:hypothetical protein
MRFFYLLFYISVNVCFGQKSVFNIIDMNKDEIKECLADKDVIVIGEIHGTKEVPAFILQLTKLMVEQNHAVTVALEINKDLQDEMDYYKKNHDGAPLFKSDYFKVKDGRTSIAMAKLITELQSMNGVEILCFDIESTESESANRDSLMAINLTVASTKKMIVLTGNLHANLNGGFHRSDFKSAMYHFQKMQRLGSRLLSLNTHFASGTVWNCMKDGCRERVIHPEEAFRSDRPNYLVIDEKSREDGYNGYLYFNSVSASKPLSE